MDERNDLDLYDKKELERYGVWVKAGPEDIVEGDEEFVMSDLVSVDDLDIPEADSDPDPFDVLSEDETKEEDSLNIPDLDSELLEEIPEDTDFLGTPATASPSVAAGDAEQIQNELREIKNELAELREVLRGVALQPQENRTTSVESPPEQDLTKEAESPASKGGFFDDTEDETIALTDDELDNILNTAEFTEETGEAQELEDDLINLEEPFPPIPEEHAAANNEIDELAEMDIDAELAEIESLDDDSSIESELDENFDEIELDLESVEEAIVSDDELGLDPVEEDEDFLTLEEDPDEAEFEAFASRVEADLSETPSDTDETAESDEADVLELEELEDFEPLAETEPGAVATPVNGDTTIPSRALDNSQRSSLSELPESIKDEIRSVLSYMDQLLEALPDDKIEEFAQSEHYGVYKNLFQELGLET